MKTLHSSIVAHAAVIAIALTASETWAQSADVPAGDNAANDGWIDKPPADADATADDTVPSAEPEEDASAVDTEERVAADATNEEAELAPETETDAATKTDAAAPGKPAAIELPGGRPSDPVAWSEPTQKTGDFVFRFNGFIRAPMRVGLGKRDNPADGQSSNTYHYPVIPDDQYLSWQYSRQNPRDWAELFFTYGNDLAQATVALSAFQFTDSAWNDSESQLGISQGYVKITPKLGDGIEFWAKVGSIWDDYGGMGRWDAGQYDTYLFGRTAVMGETLHVGKKVDDITYTFEQGFGTRRPDPSIYNTARFTLVHHEHAYVSWQDTVEVGAHYLYSWSAEESREGAEAEAAVLPDGSLSVAGVGLRLISDEWGYLFLGYSRVNAKNARTVGPAIEVINAAGGGQWELGIVGNYFDGPQADSEDHPEQMSNGTGSIDTIEAQYDVAFGEEERTRLILYGMLNSVTSDIDATNGNTKLKYGVDASHSFLPWLGMGLRYDRLQPNSKIAEQSFSIISPRVTFRTSLFSHEEISLQYARYVYNKRTCTGVDDPLDQKCVQVPSAAAGSEGFGAEPEYDRASDEDPAGPNANRGAPTKRPDVNVITLTASMWW